jgi:ClpP class serine protease
MSKAHKLLRLAHELIDNKPLLMEENSLRSIAQYLETRSDSLTALEASLLTDESERMQKVLTDNLAVIPIEGSLTYQSSFLSALCGMTTYQGLLADVEEAISLGVKTIVFSVDSGGGQAFSMVSTADAIRARLDKAGIRSIAYVDGTSASAAYGLSVIADEIVAHPDSNIGSVGVVIRLTDASEKLKKEGVKPVYITSAQSKVPFDTEGRFKEDFISELQESVDSLHTRFSQHVATYRNMSVDAVNATQAKVYDAEKALSVGFIDKIMNHDQFAEYLEQIEDSQPQVNSFMNITTLFKPKAKASAEAITTEEDDAMKLAELQAQYEDVAAKLSASVDQVTSLESQVLEALASVDEKDAELNAALSELNAIKQANLEAANASKMVKLAAVYGDEQAQEMFEALSALPEAAFDKIVSAKRLDNETVTKSPMFTEMGVTGDAETKEPLTQEEVLIARIKKQQVK